MDVNYLGAYIVAQTFSPMMIKEALRKKGLDRPSIIMVNSFAGKVGRGSRWSGMGCGRTESLEASEQAASSPQMGLSLSFHLLNPYPHCQVPVKYMSAFTASKWALAGLTEAIRAEIEPQGVHVGQVRRCVCMCVCVCGDA